MSQLKEQVLVDCACSAIRDIGINCAHLLSAMIDSRQGLQLAFLLHEHIAAGEG